MTYRVQLTMPSVFLNFELTSHEPANGLRFNILTVLTNTRIDSFSEFEECLQAVLPENLYPLVRKVRPTEDFPEEGTTDFFAWHRGSLPSLESYPVEALLLNADA